MPPLDPATEAVVERHWRAASARYPLFNGRVFCADSFSPDLIAGHWTEYRRVIAQMADPALFGTLQVRGLAVCGVLCCPDGIVVGRREARSSYQAGQWQLPPAGSIDHDAACSGGADWGHALIAELQQELGLSEADVTSLRPLGVVQHPAGVLDMGIRIDTPLRAPEIAARHRRMGDREYDQLCIAPRPGLWAAIRAEGGQLVPASAYFLSILGA